MKKERLLFICSKKPFPVQDGGAIRTMQMYRMLCEYYEVDMIFSCNDKSTYTEIPDKKLGIHSSKGFFLPKWKSIVQAIYSVFSRKPMQCAYFYNSDMHKYINDCIDNYKYVFCNNIRTAQYVNNQTKCNKIIDFVDAISMNYIGAASKRKFPVNLVYKDEAKRLLNSEIRLCTEFDKTLIISDVDAEYIYGRSKCSIKEISVIPNSVEIPEESISQSDDNNIVFIGSMFYEPNIVAVTTFAKYIFPKIIERKPNAKFFIVGNRPSDSVQRLAGDNIIVTGFVQDPKKYLKISNVVVAPMYSGAGVQNKILEAMSLGCCVVTTTIGAEGLGDIKNEKEIIIEDNYSNMAESIINLLEDKDKRTNMGLAAKKYVSNQFSYNRVLQIFRKVIIE